MEPKKMAPEEIAEIRARSPLDPWPANVWEGEMGGWCAVGPHRKRGDEGEDNDCFERAMDDARWIESARTDIPRLLSHIAALQAENERLRVIAHHAAEAARERRYQRLIENHDAYTNMARSRDAEAKEIGMAMALAIRYEEPEA